MPKTKILALIFCFATRLSPTLQQYQFPDGFEFGVATAAYQVEGGWNEDGREPSIWDAFTQNRSHLMDDGSNGNIACDSYHKWQEDVAMAKNLGVDFYRFSLSWTRLIPDGFGGNINQAGVDYYNNLIDALIENGIKPVVTLYHWDLPQIMTPLGGWTNRIIVPYFAHYARTVFTLFGDRVRTWITINEPRLVCQEWKGLVGDVVEPYPFGVVEYLCAHHILLAHAEAYHIYDKEFRHQQKGEISITLDFTWSEPLNASDPAHVKAANQWIQTEFGIYANPILGYDYPQVLVDRVAERSMLEGFPDSRLLKFSLQEKLKLRGTYDFLGINHYITYYTVPCEEPAIAKPNVITDGGGDCRYYDPSWEGSGAFWIKLVPWGLRRLLNYIKNTYNNPRIYITENGYADSEEVLNDDGRINYYREYLNATLQAIHEDGVRVERYTAWSLMDNLEWKRGYTLKFGLYHVNFTDPERTRTPKKSVEYIKNVTSTRTV